ncbi:MAG: hypothetical protein P4L35_03155 [Ignavibacteriaceae bacterium]|nr:hypothetical protein [Ignavibacteriaceae bacterium]
MEFNENQKSIFKQLKNFSEPLYFLPLLTKHFREKNTIVEFDKNTGDLVIHDTMGLNNYQEIKDLINVWMFAQENKLVYYEKVKSDSDPLEIYFKPNGSNYPQPGLPKPDLTLLLEPFWKTKIIPTFELHDFINNNFKTKDDLKFDEEREERKKEKLSREKAQKWTRITAVASIIFGLASAIIALIATGNRNVTILNPTKFPDTVKVMKYNPPADTLNFKTLNK